MTADTSHSSKSKYSQSEEIFSQLPEYIFSAYNQNGEPVEGSIHALNTHAAEKMLLEEFLYTRISLKKKGNTPQDSSLKSSIIFDDQKTSAVNAFPKGPSFIEEAWLTDKQLQFKPILQNKMNLSALLQDSCKQLEQQLDFLKQNARGLTRSSQKKYKKSFEKQFKNFVQQADRYLQFKRHQEWKNLQSVPAEAAHLYQDPFKEQIRTGNQTEEAVLNMSFVQVVQKFWQQMKQFFHIIEHPIIDNPQDLVTKQHYESFWIELKRFSGALLFFYVFFMVLSFIAHIQGYPDSLLMRMTNSLLFKRLTLISFIVFSSVQSRYLFLRKSLVSDTLIILIHVFSLLIFLV